MGRTKRTLLPSFRCMCGHTLLTEEEAAEFLRTCPTKEEAFKQMSKLVAERSARVHAVKEGD